MRCDEDKVAERKVNTEELKEAGAGLCVATLCADPETVEAVKQAVVRKSATFAGELQDYARYESDPLLLQKLQRAEVSVCVIDFDRDRAAGGGSAERHAADFAWPEHPDCGLGRDQSQPAFWKQCGPAAAST